MKKAFLTLALSATTVSIFAQQYYPLPSQCDPDKVYTYLPNAAYDNICVQSIDIKDKVFNAWPAEIYRYPNVKEIVLHNSNISSLPTDIFNLKNLEVLDLTT
jgi:Leucine-rich repeat (LRR) protein